MYALLDWCYFQRDPISYVGACMFVVATLFLGQLQMSHKDRDHAVEMTAVLEMPAPPREAPQPEPQVPPPKRVAARNAPVPTPASNVQSNAEPIREAADTAEVSQQPAPAVSSAPAIKQPAPALVQPAPERPQIQSPAASTQYEAQVLAYLERVKRYPTSREARLTRPTGTARVWFDLNRIGQLLGAGLLSSSGSNLLDAEALRTLRARSFPEFPEHAYLGDASHRFIAALKYELADSGTQ